MKVKTSELKHAMAIGARTLRGSKRQSAVFLANGSIASSNGLILGKVFFESENPASFSITPNDYKAMLKFVKGTDADDIYINAEPDFVYVDAGDRGRKYVNNTDVLKKAIDVLDFFKKPEKSFLIDAEKLATLHKAVLPCAGPFGKVVEFSVSGSTAKALLFNAGDFSQKSNWEPMSKAEIEVPLKKSIGHPWEQSFDVKLLGVLFTTVKKGKMRVWYDEKCEEPTIFGTDDYEFLIHPQKKEVQDGGAQNKPKLHNGN